MLEFVRLDSTRSQKLTCQHCQEGAGSKGCKKTPVKESIYCYDPRVEDQWKSKEETVCVELVPAPHVFVAGVKTIPGAYGDIGYPTRSQSEATSSSREVNPDQSGYQEIVPSA